MATLTIPNSFVAATTILSAEVNANFNAGATFLNTTKINFDNIQDLGVTTAKINDLAITAGKIAADAVTTVKILDSNVTAAKIVADGVTTVKILDANVTEAKLAAAVTVKISPRSQHVVDTGAGFGATNTTIRCFTNVRVNNGGTDIVYTSDATLGDKWVIGTTAVYAITYVDINPTAVRHFGISVNSASLSTDIETLTYAQGKRALGSGAGAGTPGTASWVGLLTAADVVRAHVQIATPTWTTTDSAIFTITKVSG